MNINHKLLETSSSFSRQTFQITEPDDNCPFPKVSIIRKGMEATHVGRDVVRRTAEPNSTRYVIPAYPTESKSQELWEQLEKLRNLPKGWDTYKADPPNDFALTWASKILSILIESGFPPTKIMASVEGGVGFVFTHKGKYGDIECLNSQEIVAVIYDRKTEPDAWSIALDSRSIKLAINKIQSFLNA